MKTIILKAIKKTSNTHQKQINFLNIPKIILSIEKQLKNLNYKPQKFFCFVIKDPKLREVFAPAYIDRVVQHILVDNLEPFFDPTFIFNSFANRKNKGTHFAILRLQKYLKKEKNKFYLQTDIKSFFPSIDKIILNQLISKKIINNKKLSENDKKLYTYLSYQIIWQNPINPKPFFTGNKKLISKIPHNKSLFYLPKNKGLPIGSLSSQFFANIYLDELDQFVKHTLKIKYYFRYVDDVIILGENPQILNKQKKRIQNFLKEKLKLEIHPQKTFIRPVYQGINFLGNIIFKNYRLVRKRNIKSFKRKLYFFNYLIDPLNFPKCDPPENLILSKEFKKGNLQAPIKIDFFILKKILSVINSYYGIFQFAHSYNLRKSLYEKHFHSLKKFFVVKDKSWKSMKIRAKFKEN